MGEPLKLRIVRKECQLVYLHAALLCCLLIGFALALVYLVLFVVGLVLVDPRCNDRSILVHKRLKFIELHLAQAIAQHCANTQLQHLAKVVDKALPRLWRPVCYTDFLQKSVV